MCWCHVPLPIHRAKWWKAAGTPGMIISTLLLRYLDTNTQYDDMPFPQKH